MSSMSVPPSIDRWLIVAALGLTQIIGYGILYYAFSVLAPAMAKDFDWSNARKHWCETGPAVGHRTGMAN